MTKVTLLSDYKNRNAKIKKGLSRDDKYFLGEELNPYKSLYHKILRQLGKEDFTGKFHENEISERLFFRLLTSEQKLDLENIAIKLGNIIRTIEGELKK